MFYMLAMAAISFVFTMCSNSSIPVESHWDVTKLYQNGTPIDIPQEHNPGISFLKEGKIAGETGCNRFFGDFRAEGHSLTFANMGSTRMMCPQMEFENAYLNSLSNVASFTTDEDTMTLKDKEGNTIAILKKSGTHSTEE